MHCCWSNSSPFNDRRMRPQELRALPASARQNGGNYSGCISRWDSVLTQCAATLPARPAGRPARYGWCIALRNRLVEQAEHLLAVSELCQDRAAGAGVRFADGIGEHRRHDVALFGVRLGEALLESTQHRLERAVVPFLVARIEPDELVQDRRVRRALPEGARRRRRRQIPSRTAAGTTWRPPAPPCAARG